MKSPAARRSFLLAAAFLLAALSASQSQAARHRQLWILNAYGNDIHVYDVDTLRLVRRIEVGANPHGISATADGRTVHIALEKFNEKVGELLTIDTRDGRIANRLDVGPLPNEIECTPDGHWVYVPCNDGQYWVVDARVNTVAARIRTGGRPHNTLVSRDGKRMYLVPMDDAHRVTIVDVDAGHKVIGEIPFDGACRPAAMTADERLFFVNLDGLVGFQVADIATRKVIKTIHDKVPADKQSITTRSHGLGVRPDQQEIWCCNVEHHLVHVHELASGNFDEIATLSMPGTIYWVSFTPDSKYAFVSVRSEGKVAVVDCRSKTIVALLEAGKEPKRTQVIDVED